MLTVTIPPAINSQPGNLLATNLNPIAFNVGVTGTGPFTYQWLFNGKLLPISTITTVAGNGFAFYSGNGVAATNASLNRPGNVAVDADGNLYISDSGNQRIRKVNTSGIITTVAGTGFSGFSGNGNAATNSNLNSPAGVAVDEDGELFIADTFNQRIRLETYGFLITVAGSGSQGYSGDGGAAYNAGLSRPVGVALDADGNLFIADTLNQRIRKVDLNDTITTYAGKGTFGFSGDGGAATNATLGNATGVALDAAGNLYIADSTNQRIRKVDTNGIITTVAGRNGSGYSGDGVQATNSSLSNPNDVAVDGYGNLYIADTFNQRIRKVDASGIITTVAGRNGSGFFGDGGAATNASLNQPTGVAVDVAGNLYIADMNNSRIRKVTIQGPALTFPNVNPTNAGNYQVIISSGSGSVTSSVVTLTVQQPPYVILQPTNQSIANGHGVIFNASAGGNPQLTYQWRLNGTNLPGRTIPSLSIFPVSSAIAGPYQLVVSNLYGSVTSSPAILTITYPPVFTQQPQSVTVGPGQTASLTGAVTGDQPFAYQWYFNGALLAGQNSTNLTLTSATPAATGLYYLVVTNLAGKATSSSALVTVTGTPVITQQPVGGAVFAGGGTQFTASAGGISPLHYQWQQNGTNLPGVPNLITTVAGHGVQGFFGDGGAAVYAMLSIPYGVAVDNQGNLFMADSWNNRVRKVDRHGLITTFAGNGLLGYSGDGGPATNASMGVVNVAVDVYGNLFMADQANNVVRKVDGNGIITTVAGTGVQAYSGDGGPATNAALNFCGGVAVDANGNLFIADSGNNIIRKVDSFGVISTVAGTGVAGYAGDGGLATNATLKTPFGLTVDVYGNVFIAENYNQVIRKVDTNGIITTVAGNGIQGYSGDGGAATNASLNSASGVAIDGYGNMYIGDSYNQVVRKVDTNGIITTFAGNGSLGYSGDGGTATNATMNGPACVTVDLSGNLFITDSYNDAIREVVPSGGTPTLALDDVAAGNAGNYQLIITNAYGSVTSSVVTLTVSAMPLISVASNGLGGVTLNLLTAPNSSSQVLAATNLTPPVVWQSLGAGTPGANGGWQFTDADAGQYPVRFYRTSTP